MANEGSTKPTYSELAKKLVDECSVYGDDPHSGFVGLDHEKVEKILEEAVEDEAGLARGAYVRLKDLQEKERELARVRGLLQRYGVHKADCGTWDVTYGDRENKELMAKACDCGLTAELANFPQSSSLVSQGAESADKAGEYEAVDRAIGRLSMALGNPCVDFTDKTIGEAVIDYAIERLKERAGK